MKLSVIVKECFSIFITLITINIGVVKAQWNTNTAVNLQISGLELADMETASTTDGKLWVAFYQHTPLGNYDMRAQLFDASGNKLLGADGVIVSTKPSGTATYVFGVCVDASNNLVIGCQDQRSGTDQCVLYKISQNGTHLWGTDGVLLGAGLAPNVALLTTGDIVTAWNDDATNTLLMQKIAADGTQIWATPIAVYVGTAKTTRGQIVPNSNGRFTMVYQKKGTAIYTTLYAQQFYNTGIAQYAPLQICNETTQGTRYYSVMRDGDTTYVGYFSSAGSRFNSWLQRVNPNGTIPWGMNGSHFNTSTGGSDNYQMTTNINLSAGSPYIWAVCSFTNTLQTNYGIYVQKFLKTTGARQLTDQAKMVYPINAARNEQIGNLILVNDEPMFAHHESDDKIYVTKLNASGGFVWPYNRAAVSSTVAGGGNPKMRHNFNMVGNNRCAAVWSENRLSNYLGYIQGISIGGLFGLDVATQGGIPATITAASGTLQLTSTVFPSYANQQVNWSVIHVTGYASINNSGLVTAFSNGTVWAKATAVQDITVMDSILITISGQSTVSVKEDSKSGNFEVIPNPGNGHFEIKTSTLTRGKYSIEIYNSLGVNILKQEDVMIDGLFSAQFNLSNYPEGTYFIVLQNKDVSITKKVVIRH